VVGFEDVLRDVRSHGEVSAHREEGDVHAPGYERRLIEEHEQGCDLALRIVLPERVDSLPTQGLARVVPSEVP
jgi:hypothetical protein